MRKRKKSEADWAVEILAQRQEPVFYEDLIKEIAVQMGKPVEKNILNSIYTRINLDNRLVYKGDGYWFYDTSRINREA